MAHQDALGGSLELSQSGFPGCDGSHRQPRGWDRMDSYAHSSSPVAVPRSVPARPTSAGNTTP